MHRAGCSRCLRIDIGALLLLRFAGGGSMIVKAAIIVAVVAISLGIDAAVLHGTSASVVSDAKKLKDADDYIKAFYAWLDEDTPFGEYIKIAIKQLESLKRKQKALRADPAGRGRARHQRGHNARHCADLARQQTGLLLGAAHRA